MQDRLTMIPGLDCVAYQKKTWCQTFCDNLLLTDFVNSLITVGNSNKLSAIPRFRRHL